MLSPKIPLIFDFWTRIKMEAGSGGGDLISWDERMKQTSVCENS
jgi:hypothetical protein